jgi:hypothetical protein
MMTAPEIYALARAAGFPPVVAVTMTAIALRESSGDPNAFNGNAATGDKSYGLWQINMRDKGIAALIAAKVLEPTGDVEQLFDPAKNAKAAFLLWGGSNKNLSVAWYIDHPGIYRDRYESHLPAAQAAALAAGGI